MNIARLNASQVIGNWVSTPHRSVIQCQLVCATSVDSRMVPTFSATTWRNIRWRAGTSTASTSNWPSSTPMLNDSSDVSRCEPANCRVSRSANENPNPCTSPNRNVMVHRRCTLAPRMFSMAMYTMDIAIRVSTIGGNHSASGARS